MEGPYGAVGEFGPMNAVLVLRVRGSFTETMVRQAVDCVQRRFEGARVRLVRRGTTLAYSTEGVPEVPVRLTVKTSGQDWISAAERELNQPFPASGPYFRFTALLPESPELDQSVDLILTSHHVVGDLNTAFRVCDDFLKACQQILEGRTPAELPEILLPAIDDSMLPPEVLGPAMARRVRFAKAQAALIASPAKSDMERRTRIHLRELPAGYLSAIERAARRRRLVPASLPLAAKLIALARVSGVSGEQSYDWGMFVDARELLVPPVGPDRSGCLVLLQKAFSQVRSDDDPWDLARRISAQAESFSVPAEAFTAAILAREVVPDLLARGVRQSAREVLTYNGRIRFRFVNSPDFEVIQNWSQASVHTFGPECLSSITEFEATTTWNIAYAEPDMDAAHISRLLDEAILVVGQALAVPAPTSARG